MFPFLGFLWMTWPLRTVIREQQAVDGTEGIDFAVFFLCFPFQGWQLYMNSKTMPEKWRNDKLFESFGKKGSLIVQECHEVNEKLNLD